MSSVLLAFLVQYILPIVGTVLSTLLIWGAKKLIDYLDMKTQHLTLNLDVNKKETIKSDLENMISTAVYSTNQTFVNSIKEKSADGKLTKEETIEAMNLTIKNTKDLLGPELINEFKNVYNTVDVDTIIKHKIEETIHLNK